MSSDEYSNVSSVSQRPKVKTILKKKEGAKKSPNNNNHSPRDALVILSKQELSEDIEEIQQQKEKHKNKQMLLESQMSDAEESNFSVSYQDQLSRTINSDSDGAYSDPCIETEEEEIIITGREEVYAKIQEKFQETRFDLKHITEIVRDLENRVQSLYDNALYVLLAQQRKWYKLFK